MNPTQSTPTDPTIAETKYAELLQSEAASNGRHLSLDAALRRAVALGQLSLVGPTRDDPEAARKRAKRRAVRKRERQARKRGRKEARR